MKIENEDEEEEEFATRSTKKKFALPGHIWHMNRATRLE
jgi:hypothetical protein